MDFQQVIEARRSVRKFRDEEVPHEVLAQAIEAALHAPSSRNSRSTRFLAVRDAATVHRMAAMRDYGAVPLAGAPAAVVVMGDRAASDLWVDNAAIAATILQLALVDAGLKSCWVHVNGRPRSKEQPDGEQADSRGVRRAVRHRAGLLRFRTQTAPRGRTRRTGAVGGVSAE